MYKTCICTSGLGPECIVWTAGGLTQKLREIINKSVLFGISCSKITVGAEEGYSFFLFGGTWAAEPEGWGLYPHFFPANAM